MLELRAANAELSFEQGQHEVTTHCCQGPLWIRDRLCPQVMVSRLRQRNGQLQALATALRSELARIQRDREPADGASVADDASVLETGDARTAVEALRKVVAQLRSENALLKRSTHSHAKYMELAKETKRLKAEVRVLPAFGRLRTRAAQMDELRGAAESKARADAAQLATETRRLSDLNAQLRRAARREQDIARQASARAAEQAQRADKAEAQAAQLRAELEAAQLAEDADALRQMRALRAAAGQAEARLEHQVRSVVSAHARMTCTHKRARAPGAGGRGATRSGGGEATARGERALDGASRAS